MVLSARADATVVFNELASRSSGGNLYQWVELYNQLAVDMDLSGWTLEGQALPSGTTIRGRSYLVLAVGTNALQTLQSAGVTNVVNVPGQMANRLTLRNNNGRVMDVFDAEEIGWWPKHGGAISFTWAKVDPELVGNIPENWRFSTSRIGTPGQSNFPGVGRVQAVKVIGQDDLWRYYDAATLPALGWQGLGYNDSGWALGRPLLYNGTNRITEVRSIPTLFNSGVDDSGRVLTAGSADPHYRLTVSAQGGAPTQATVTQNHPNWMANDSASSWIGPVANGTVNVAAGNYYYVTTFSLTGFEYQNAVLQMLVAVDNNLNQVLLNGVAQTITASGFNTWYGPFTITNGFVPGTNTLEFRCSNAGTDPSGFRVLLSGTAPQTLTNTPLASGRSAYYFRRPFVINSAPEATRLLLRAMVDDGAVVYLNGVELVRLNMPEGEITPQTPALTNVVQPSWTAPLVVYPTNLVLGTNWLAVELHQAVGGEGDAVFGMEVSAEPYPLPPATLVINELTGTTNNNFLLELFNYGTNDMALEGCELASQAGNWPVYVFSNVPPLPPGGFYVVTGEQLGWTPLPDGYRTFENINITLWSPGAQRVYDTVVFRKGPRARYPDGAGDWMRPGVMTPGQSNQVSLTTDVVINEIMYHPPLIFSSNAPPKESDAQWIELYNRGSNSVDLSGWMLDGGVRYLFPPGVSLTAGGYLVVANDAATLRAAHPAINIIGEWVGRLSHRGERVILRNADGNPVDEVRYYDSHPWPAYADGGGSSLELMDPWADNSNSAAWAASNEKSRGTWQTISYRMVAAFPGSTQPTTWQDFVLGLLDAGECLVDDISVVENPGSTPVEIIGNGNFENGLTGWRVLGNHGQSRVITDPDNPGNHVLHLVATGAQEHMHNHVETTLTAGRTIVNGREYQISFRARWLAGNNLLNTRLYFNRVARTSVLPRPVFTGTPGAPNSRRVANLGPTLKGLQHQPVVPQPGIPVTVSVVASDPQGVAECRLYWSVNGGSWNSVVMSRDDQQFSGIVPGGSAGDIVQFYVRATDGAGATADCPPAGPDSGALYAVDDGQAEFTRGHNIRLILTPANRNLLHDVTNVMSNARLPGTIVYDEYRPYYDCGIRLKGSERGRWSDVRVSFHLTFPADQPFRGVHPVMLIDRSGQGGNTDNKQLEMVIKHMLHHAGDIPGVYSDLCKVIAPFNRHSSSAILSPRLEDEFIETAFENGGDGDLYEFELIYYPTTTNSAGYKLPNPDSVIAVDFQNLGDDPELYRYNFIKKNHRDVDDYSLLIPFAKTFSLATAGLDAQSRRLMDVDEWMRVWAFVTLCGVGDTYTFGIDHNVAIYRRPADDKFLAFPIDMDFSFSRAANSALVGDRNFSRLINEIPANKRRFYAHVKDIIQSTYNNAYMDRWISHYNSFVPEQNYSAIPSYLATRISTANTEIANAGGNATFALTSSTNLVVGTNLVTIAGTAPVEAADILVNGQSYPITWINLSSWTMRVPISSVTNDLVVTAYDVNGVQLSNYVAGATVIYTNAIPSPVGLVGFTEIMYNPTYPNAEYVEIYNASPYFTFDLSGWRINGLDYQFPSGAYLTPRSYLVLVKNRSAFESAYGTGVTIFDEYPGNLQANDETLTLLQPGPTGEVVVDRVRYEPDAPWPRSANGLGASLQLKDVTQRRDRVINWLDGLNWQFKSFTMSNTLTLSFTNLYFRFSNAGEVWLDDLRVEEGSVVGGGSNYVVNGGFEEPLEGTWVKGTLVGPTERDGTLSRSGQYSLRLVATGRAQSVAQSLSQPLTLKTGTTYTVSFWYLPSQTVTGLHVYLTAFVNSNVMVHASVHARSPGAAAQGERGLPELPLVWLNEVQAENVEGVADNYGEREPWVELYNVGSTAVDLTGWYLANQYTNLGQWAFAAGTVLGPGEYRVVWCDGQEGQSEGTNLHTSFRLSGGTGSVALVMPVGAGLEVLDYLNYRGLLAGRSYGNYPDGQPVYRRVFHYATAGTTNNPALAPVPVFINEWMADNINSLTDPADLNNEDWFELYNAGDAEVDLSGYYLTDSTANPFQFRIPDGWVIPAQGFLVVWADNEPGQNVAGGTNLHVNFALSSRGESISLYTPEGVLVDRVSFGSQLADISEGRYPNGGALIGRLMEPTPGAPNASVISTENTPPTLGLLLHRRLLVGQTLAFTATATDAETAASNLVFSLGPDAPAGAVISADGHFVWTPQQPGTNQVWILVTDTGAPPLTASNYFIVRVGALPRFSNGNAVLEQGRLQLRIEALDGLDYRLEFKNRLNDLEWQLLGTLQPTNGWIHFSESVTNGQRFYRLRQSPVQ